MNLTLMLPLLRPAFLRSTFPAGLALLGICLWLTTVASTVYAAPEQRTETSIIWLLQKLASDDFSDRVQAQRELALRAAFSPEQLALAYPEANPEARARLLQLLEGVFLAHADERGDRAERALMAIRDAGSVTAQSILTGNAQLRESRAKQAIERLGGQLSYMHPANNNTPSITAPVVGVGFGDPAELRTILVPEDWKGQPEDLWQFGRLSHQQNLVLYNIRGNHVSIEDLLPLSASLIGLRVEVRGACLGIQASPGSPKAEILSIVEKSAAAEAGLQRNDQIEKLNDVPVRNFTHLVDLLTEYRPGDKVIMQIRRDVELLNVPVTLASWKTILSRELQTVPPPTPFPGPLGIGTPVSPLPPEPAPVHANEQPEDS